MVFASFLGESWCIANIAISNCNCEGGQWSLLKECVAGSDVYVGVFDILEIQLTGKAMERRSVTLRYHGSTISE